MKLNLPPQEAYDLYWRQQRNETTKEDLILAIKYAEQLVYIDQMVKFNRDRKSTYYKSQS